MKWSQVLLPVFVYVSLGAYKGQKHMLRSVWSPRLMDHLCHERKPKGLIEMMNAQIGSNPLGIFTQGSQTVFLKITFIVLSSRWLSFLLHNTYCLWESPFKYWAEIIIWNFLIKAICGLPIHNFPLPILSKLFSSTTGKFNFLTCLWVSCLITIITKAIISPMTIITDT